MAILELIIAKIGESVAKAILKMWLGESGIVGILAGSSVDIISSVAVDVASKRKLEREFHQVADRIAENILPLLEGDGPRLPENDTNAVIIALGNAIERTDITPITLIKSYDLRAAQLAKEILNNTESERRAFSADANALIERLAGESAGYIIEISTRLPAFSPALFSELLQRQKQLDDVVVEVLNEIRKLSETTRALNPEEEAGKFERRYRTAIAHRNDEVELFGLDAPSKIRRQNLKVAYVTLSMQRKAPRRQRLERVEATAVSDLSKAAAAIVSQSQFMPGNLYRATMNVFGRSAFRGTVSLRALFNSESCDAILASVPRLLIRGEAGSGKTTLLQWVTVSAASQRLDGPLKNWNEAVPLLVQLRQYAEKPLPSPTELVTNAMPEIADGLPLHWVENILEAGRGLILLDGIDELDSLKREEVRNWIRSLIATYPHCRYILTSRIAAVEEDWLSAEKFEEAELLPMGWPDVDNLIDHWHNALAIQQSVVENHDELKGIATQLKKQLRQNRRLADLATSPLLCAMLCALHYERRQQLPPNRIALYDSAIRMLLDQRDRARGIGKLKLPDLTEDQKRAFLERLAYWMLRNNFAATTLAEATSEIARTRPVVQNLPGDATPIKIIELLIQRSGIVRSPAQGYVDFVHKTFQEFLGAKAIVDAADLPFLVSNAHEDQWHETVVLAAGIAPQIQRDDFLRALIARGELEQKYRHKLYLLAVACLETAVKLSPEVEKLLDEHIKLVIPPHNMTEARSLKAAGSLAVPLLKRKSAYGAREAAASVRALAMIGGEDSLSVLESYAEDPRITVSRELISGWTNFDNQEYARRVLANCQLEHGGGLSLSKNSNLQNLQYLSRLRSLYLLDPSPIETLSDIAKLVQLEKLYIEGGQNISSIGVLKELIRLKELDLENASKLTSLAPLGGLIELAGVFIFGLKELKELFRPNGLKKLRRFFCTGAAQCEWSPQDRFADALEMFVVPWPVNDFNIFSEATRLKYLDCRFANDSKNVGVIESMKSLQNLEVKLAPNTNIEWLEHLTSLISLEISGLGSKDLAPLYEMGALIALQIEGGKNIDIANVVKGRPLKNVTIQNTHAAAVFPNLEEATSLRHLSLVNVSGLADVSAIAEIPNVETVRIISCPDVQGLDALRQKLVARRVGVHFPSG